MDLQTAMTPPNDHCDCNECEAARVCAAEIHRLRAENERKDEALRDLHASYAHSQEQFLESEKDGARLRAEVERLKDRLRGAVKFIEEEAAHHPGWGGEE